MGLFKPRAPKAPASFSLVIAPSPESIRRQEEYAALPIDVVITRIKAELAKLRRTLGYIEEANRGDGAKYLAMTGDDVTRHWEAYQVARAQPVQREQMAASAQAEIDRILQEVA